jgi:hypothetical protein
MDFVELSKPFTQSDFSGGMRRNCDPTALGDNEYLFLQNGRVRYGTLDSVKLPLDISTGLPSNGRLQGMYIGGNLMFAFVDGKVFYRNLADEGSIFSTIGNFEMSGNVPVIYAQFVPASTINLRRESDSPEGGIRFTKNGSSTPSALICQDGVNQPRVILSTFDTRLTRTISDWTLGNQDTGEGEDREYVPIGRQMLYTDGVLYIVSPNKKEIYRSVTGRPLDFVIAVDENGNKLSELPENGIEASRLSHRVDYDDIVSIGSITLTQALTERLPQNSKSAFFVSTTSQSYLVYKNQQSYNLFSEPYLGTIPLFPTSPINQFSIVDLFGDTGFIDPTGLKSVEAILTSGQEGHNLGFSSALDYLFKRVGQDDCCCDTHDNYAFFCVKTIYGYRIIVYDTLSQVFVSIDNYTNIVGHVTWIKAAIINNTRRLYIGTSGAKIYEVEAGAITAPRVFFSKEWQYPNSEIKPVMISTITQNNRESGTIYATEFVDRQAGIRKSETIKKTLNDEEGSVSVIPPFGNIDSDGDIQEANLAIIDGVTGTKISVKVETDFDTSLFMVSLDTFVNISKVGLEQMGKAYNT